MVIVEILEPLDASTVPTTFVTYGVNDPEPGNKTTVSVSLDISQGHQITPLPPEEGEHWRFQIVDACQGSDTLVVVVDQYGDQSDVGSASVSITIQ